MHWPKSQLHCASVDDLGQVLHPLYTSTSSCVKWDSSQHCWGLLCVLNRLTHVKPFKVSGTEKLYMCLLLLASPSQDLWHMTVQKLQVPIFAPSMQCQSAFHQYEKHLRKTTSKEKGFLLLLLLFCFTLFFSFWLTVLEILVQDSLVLLLWAYGSRSQQEHVAIQNCSHNKPRSKREREREKEVEIQSL